MFANGAAAALDVFYCCHVVLTINGGSFCGTIFIFSAQTAAGCEKHFPRREYSVGMHGVAIHATHCQHRIRHQFTEAVRGIRDIVGRVATIAGGCAARHFRFTFLGFFLKKPEFYLRGSNGGFWWPQGREGARLPRASHRVGGRISRGVAIAGQAILYSG